MTTPHLTASLRHVVQAATLAPSVHNTQPWRFVTRPDGFDLHADPGRRLPVLDPTGRQLHLSCGAALLTARVAARALGLLPSVELLPEPAQPELLARLHLSAGPPAGDEDISLALAILKRHTVRGPFRPDPLPDDLLDELRRCAEEEDAVLRPLRGDDELLELEVLLSWADAAEEADPHYRRELASWVHEAALGDGIPPTAVQPPSGRGTSLRLRDFTLSAPERSAGDAPPPERPAVVVVATDGDGPRAWLEGGQALGAVLLHAAARGVQGQPLGQVTDLPAPRRRLAAALGMVAHPQLVLRLGYAAASATTPRRDLDEVLV